MTVRSLSAASAVLLCLASLAACSSSPATSAATGCNDPGVSKNEVRVGLIYPDTGALATTFLPVRSGLNARLGAINESGGVNGRQIHYSWSDDRGRVDTNAVASRDRVENEKDFAVIEATPVSSGGADYLATNNVPVVGIAVEPAWSKYRNMFTYSLSRNASTSSEAVTTFGRYAQEKGGTRALVVGDPAGLSISDGIAQQMRSSLQSVGIPTLSTSADESPTDAQIREIIRLISTNNVDILASPLTIETFSRIVATVRQAGVQPKVVLSGGQPPGADLLATYGPLLAGLTTYAVQPPDSSAPGAAAYRAAMIRFAPELQDRGQSVAVIGYILGDMIIEGLKAAGPCPTRARFISGLRAVKNYTAGGLIPSVDFEHDFGKVSLCYPFSAVNATGTGETTIDPNFCGERIAG